MSAPSSRPYKSLNPPITRTEPAKTTRNRTRNRNRNRQPVQPQATDAPSHDSNAIRQVPNTSLSSSNDHLQNGESSNLPDTDSEVSSSPQQTDPSPNNLPSWHAQGFSQHNHTASYYPHPQSGAAEAFPHGFFTSYNQYAGQPATNPAPYYPLTAFGDPNMLSGHPDPHSSAAIQASYYQAANYQVAYYQAQRAGYYPQPYPQGIHPSSYDPHPAYRQACETLYIQSHPYYSQAPNPNSNSFNSYAGRFDAAPYNSYVRPRRSLLDQSVFFLDSFGHSAISDQQNEALKQAISVAHRLVFSKSSLEILSRVLAGYSHYGRSGNAHIAATLDTLVRSDGMLVVLDSETRRSGLVRNEDPSVLRVNVTLVKQAIRARDQSKNQIHIFYLASVIAHLICRSIQVAVGDPRAQDILGWESQFFGGMIERVAALPGLWGAVEGEIEHLRVVFQDSGGLASVIVPGDAIKTLIEGHPGWQRLLPLSRHPDDILRGRHVRQLSFDEVEVDKEDRPENRTPEGQIKHWFRDIGDVIEDPRGLEMV